jgi:hypothetical protein
LFQDGKGRMIRTKNKIRSYRMESRRFMTGDRLYPFEWAVRQHIIPDGTYTITEARSSGGIVIVRFREVPGEYNTRCFTKSNSRTGGGSNDGDYSQRLSDT